MRLSIVSVSLSRTVRDDEGLWRTAHARVDVELGSDDTAEAAYSVAVSRAEHGLRLAIGAIVPPMHPEADPARRAIEMEAKRVAEQPPQAEQPPSSAEQPPESHAVDLVERWAKNAKSAPQGPEQPPQGPEQPPQGEQPPSSAEQPPQGVP